MILTNPTMMLSAPRRCALAKVLDKNRTKRSEGPNYAYPAEVDYANSLPPEQKAIHLAAWGITVEEEDKRLAAQFMDARNAAPHIFRCKLRVRRSR